MGSISSLQNLPLQSIINIEQQRNYETYKKILSTILPVGFSDKILQLNILLDRCAIKNSEKSSVWRAVEKSLKSSRTELFDTYDSLTDAEEDFILYPDYPNHDYLGLLLSSFEKNLDLFKANYLKILECIERLIFIGKLIDANMLINQVINKHLASVDISPLLHTFIRICSTFINSSNLEPRNEFCSKILCYLTSKLQNVKTDKSVSPLYFDLIIAILKLSVIDAPQNAQYMITRSEFFQWKDLGPRINELLSICIAYESIVLKTYFSNLGALENIVKVIDERAKLYPIILQSTHSTALQAILRWSHKDAKYSIHVYKMSYSMLNLIDQHQINIDVCSQLLDGLLNRLDADGGDDDRQEFNRINLAFFSVS